jgi:hypothetical protein
MRAFLLVSVLMLAVPAAICDGGSIGYLSDGPIESVRMVRRVCSDDNLYVHHDGTFEDGVCWDASGVEPPYDGAFGEAFDLGPGMVECVSFWLTQIGGYQGQSTDVYVWEGGVAEEPGGVLEVVTGIVLEDIPIWPEAGRYDVEIPSSVPGGFTVGSWGNWPGQSGNPYFWCTDRDGPVGHPWTHVVEGQGYPSGWQNPEVIWGFPIHSMGIGVHFTGGGSPVVPTTWGSVKSLFAAS